MRTQNEGYFGCAGVLRERKPWQLGYQIRISADAPGIFCTEQAPDRPAWTIFPAFSQHGALGTPFPMPTIENFPLHEEPTMWTALSARGSKRQKWVRCLRTCGLSYGAGLAQCPKLEASNVDLLFRASSAPNSHVDLLPDCFCEPLLRPSICGIP